MFVENENDLSVDIRKVSRDFSDDKQWFRKTKGRPQVGALAVDNLSLEIKVGEIFGLVGPNGAGKTTLIKMICSLLYPSFGQIAVHGLDTVTQEAEVKRVVGLVTSNERSFYWRLTGQQNLEFFASIYRMDRASAAKWIDQLLSFLSLDSYRHQRFDSYSTGIKQRFAFARGLLNKPRVLLLDEPTKGVDPVSASEIVNLVRDQLFSLWRPTIIVTSHNLSEVELICRRIAIMNHGVIVADGTFKELQLHVDAPQQYDFHLQPGSSRFDTRSFEKLSSSLLTFEFVRRDEGDG